MNILRRREVLTALSQTEPGRRKLAQLFRTHYPNDPILIASATMIDAILKAEFPDENATA